MSKVIVGVDGSAPSQAALMWALREAQLCGVQLVAVCAYDAIPAYTAVSSFVPPYAGLGLAERPEAEIRALAAARLGQYVAAARRSADVDVVVSEQVVSDAAAHALRELAGPEDLLVVGTHGHSAVYSALLGSTSHYLATHARCPVVLIRSSD